MISVSHASAPVPPGRSHMYIISAAFDYGTLVARDVGPAYAADMGWQWDTFQNLPRYRGGVVMIDNRLTGDECLAIKQTVVENPRTLFLFTLVDPYYEWQKSNPYSQTVFELKHRDNVFFLSKYTPKELTKDLDEATGSRKMVVLPYPFRGGLSQPIHFPERRHKLVVTGNMHAGVYPLRSAVRKLARWNPLTWGRIECLDHPGYVDIGHERKHSIIGGAFVDYLAGFTLMLVCPSRAELEFLKYSECAYAGCVPVGQAPASFDAGLGNCVLALDPARLTRSLRAIFKIPLPELEQRAKEFRSRMEAARAPQVLNEELNAFLQKLGRSPLMSAGGDPRAATPPAGPDENKL